MTNTDYFIFVAAGLVLGYIAYLIKAKQDAKKEGDKKIQDPTVAKNTVSVVEKFEDDEIERLQTPGFEKVAEIRNEKNFDATVNFKLETTNTIDAQRHLTAIMKEYQIINIVPEPNSFENSLVVKLERTQLGYVPESIAQKVNEIHESGNYLAYISYIDWDNTSPDYTLNVDVVIEYKE